MPSDTDGNWVDLDLPSVNPMTTGRAESDLLQKNVNGTGTAVDLSR